MQTSSLQAKSDGRGHLQTLASPELFLMAGLLPLLMFHVARISSFLLTNFNARYPAQTHKRQRCLDALCGVIVGKIILVIYALPLLQGSWNEAHSAQLQVAYLIHVAIYIFDMTYRQIGLSLYIHHLSAIAVSSLAMTSMTHTPTNLYLGRLGASIATFAMGLSDLGADFALLGYYILPLGKARATFLAAATNYLAAMRFVQWTWWIHYHATSPVVDYAAVAFMAPAYPIWIREEYIEYRAIAGLAAKVAAAVTEGEENVRGDATEPALAGEVQSSVFDITITAPTLGFSNLRK